METAALVANPFGTYEPATIDSATAASDQQRAIAEVQAGLVMAQHRPRDPIKACDRILQECARSALLKLNADGIPAALYTYRRGGQEISGPSIRVAEAMARNWGNMTFGIRELSQDRHISNMEAFAWDLETNTRTTVTFQVPHRRHTQKGSYLLEDPRDIYEMVMNMGARRLRACILRLIPGDVTDAAVKQIETSLAATVDLTPERLKAMVDVFAEQGVTRDMLEKHLQHRIDATTPAEFLRLGKISNSLKDGMGTIGDWFVVEQMVTDADKDASIERLKAQLRQQSADQGPPPTPPEPPPTPIEEGEFSFTEGDETETEVQPPAPIGFTLDEILKALRQRIASERKRAKGQGLPDPWANYEKALPEWQKLDPQSEDATQLISSLVDALNN